jgi:hypothetical protein
VAVVVMNPAAYAQMERITNKLADHVTDEVFNDAFQAATPPMGGFATGEMQSTIRKQGHQVWVGTDHWHFVEYGTRPHLILPHGNWPLRDRSRGKYFGFVVHHPGATENPFMRRAIHQKRRLPYVGAV